jgi:hypothetical protein
MPATWSCFRCTHSSRIIFFLYFFRFLFAFLFFPFSFFFLGFVAVSKEATWAIANLFAGGSAGQCQFAVNQGALNGLCHILHGGDAKLSIVILEAFDNAISKFVTSEPEAMIRPKIISLGMIVFSDLSVLRRLGRPIKEYIEQSGGLEAIETLQQHEDPKVYEDAVAFLSKHFGDDQDEDEEEDDQGQLFGSNSSNNNNRDFVF